MKPLCAWYVYALVALGAASIRKTAALCIPAVRALRSAYLVGLVLIGLAVVEIIYHSPHAKQNLEIDDPFRQALCIVNVASFAFSPCCVF